MNTPVKDLVQNQSRVIYLQTSDSAAFALATLDKYNITSAPVIDGESKIHGFLDVLDLAIYLTRVASKPMHSNVTPESTKMSTDDMDILIKRSAEFNLSQVADAMDCSKRNPYFPLHEDQTLKEAVLIFLRGPHRIAVTNSSNKIINILTQSDIIRWIAADTSRMGIRAEKTASEIMKPVESIHPDSPTIDAFNHMIAKGLSSLAIVDEYGIIHGTLSVSDLKSLKEYRFLKLLQKVSDFVAEIRKEQNRKADYVLECRPDAHLKDIIKRINHEHVHRIFVMGDDRKPLGVISLTDIIGEVFGNQEYL